ncbi:GMC family oxidoreductase [Actinomadura flavalba]|uniref:GMC family oxidoreductase n=1 Tax=Actinomadura flavalba TaxID=1120938 RepID=UPI000374B6CF|nr:GMC family oxidoreductase N-terminal domain-containing protein [Actinomadura flavalba]
MSDAPYDYVIVGAGSAGCVLAARLSEDPDVRVCLIEAGPADTHPDIHLPLGAGRLFRTRLDWDYDTHDEPVLNGRRLYLPRGRVLGGTTALNGMVYIRGHRSDYDGWGRPGWGFDDLLPYFLRSEDNERGASEHHATGGPLSVSEGRSRNPISAAFVTAAVQAGHAANADFNGAGMDGFGLYQLTQRDGRRCSNAVAFLHPALDRPNLTVLTNVQVHRVLLEQGRARGVVGERLDERVEVRAEREVLLSAGAYNSPQLLLLSGVGPADELRALDITVTADLPGVGRNLQDHPAVNLVYTHSQPVSLLAASEPEALRLYEEEQAGPLTSNVPEAGGFARTRPDLDVPDVQFHASPLMLLNGGLSAPTEHALSFGPCVLAPRSRGDVTLASGDPTAKPRIRHAYYTDDADLRTMTEGLRIGLEIARQEALAPYTEKAYLTPESTSEEDLRDFAVRNTQTLFHPAGTCAIGDVLDDELRVRGVEGLRVVDASVMPALVRGNTNAPITAIAERAADLVRGRAARPSAG